MSQEEDFVLASPVASEAKTPVLDDPYSSPPPHDPIDVQILNVQLTKDQLINIALSKITELRADKKVLLRDKENALRQVEELRMCIRGMQQRKETEEAQQPSASVSQPLHFTNSSSSVNNQHSIRKQLTKPALPEKFNGVDKSPTISNWLFAVRLYLKVTRTDEEDYVMMATTLFTSTAIDWWQGIVRAEGESVYRWSWEEFEARCIRRFQAVNDAQVAYQRLLRWKQIGTITTYLAGFQSMVQQIPFELLPEAGRVFLLIEGLNPELQKSVRLVQPTTLDEAIGIAQRVSVMHQPPRQSNRSPPRPPHRQPSTTNRSNSQLNRTATGSRFAPLTVENIEETSLPSTESAENAYEDEGSTSEVDLSYLNAEQKKLYQDGRCFKCKQKGHRGKDCRSTNKSTKEQARV
jgi:Ty3 transposon capsid-like protein